MWQKLHLFNEIEINHNKELESEEVIDRWNNWVFELSTEPQYESEEANKQLELRNSINISKITPDIKLEIEMDHFFNREKFIENVNTDSATTSTYTTSALMINNLFVKSISDHWSAGVLWDLGSSTRENLNFRTDFLPSIEYDIYPYSEATHRQLRILYSAGMQINNYIDSTVYNKMKETLYLQRMNVAFQLQKKWGSINLLLMGSNYFHDFSKNRIELIGSVRIRIFKGLSLDINGGVAHINDQLSLNKGDISEAERLLQLRELQQNTGSKGELNSHIRSDQFIITLLIRGSVHPISIIKMHERFKYKTKDDLQRKAKDLGFDLPYSDDITPLFQPYQLARFSIANRLVVQPMEGYDSENDGSPSELSIRRYMRYASGGSGIIWHEAVSVMHDGRSNPHQLWINKKNTDNYSRLNEDVRKNAIKQGIDPFLVVQLTHSGRYSKPEGIAKPQVAALNPLLDKIPPWHTY